MGRRRRDSTEEIVKLVMLAVIGLGVVIVHYAKIIVGIGIMFFWTGLAIAGAFGLYRLGKILWRRSMNLSAWQPEIDWDIPQPESCGLNWPKFQYSQLSNPPAILPAHVVGTSGAWKDVTKMLEPFPFLTAGNPADLKTKIGTMEAGTRDLIQKTMAVSVEAEPAMHLQAARHRQQVGAIAEQYERSIRAKLAQMETDIRGLEQGGWFDRIRAEKLRVVLAGLEQEFSSRLTANGKRNQEWDQATEIMMNPQTREQRYREMLAAEMGRLREILQSNEYAGAVAEMAVIEELKRLPPGCVVLNDLHLKSPRYIHFEGKPLMSAQIDTLVVTPGGVFVVEVKNWSREFAETGRGFNPFEQVSRAGYLVYDRLRGAGIRTRVTSVLTSMGALPARNGEKVVTLPVRSLRSFIQSRPAVGLDVEGIREALAT
jgi:hypothetical protein